MTRPLRFALVLGCALAACAKPATTLRNPEPIATPPPASDKLLATEAHAQGKTGVVQLVYCVDTGGHTKDVRVTGPLDPELDALAVETLEAWTYRPALRNGVAKEQCTDVSIEFR